LVSNIVINVRNVLSDLGVIGEIRESTDISTLDQPSALSPSEFDSGIIQPGQIFKHAFYEAGTIEYYCTVHPAMVGKILFFLSTIQQQSAVLFHILFNLDREIVNS
jgi:hypothetical protein